MSKTSVAEQPEPPTAVRSKEWLAANLKCKNGDTLKELNDQWSHANSRVVIAREKVLEAEEAIKPLKETYESAVSARMNISCRLNIWWGENRKQYEAANAEVRDPAT